MRSRGQKYRQWAESELHPFCHAAILPSGIQVDIQVQLSAGVTLIFIGIYLNTGKLIFEECYGTLHKDNLTAVDWARYMAERAVRAYASGGV
jgi:hypothetical protein